MYKIVYEYICVMNELINVMDVYMNDAIHIYPYNIIYITPLHYSI